MKQTDNHPSFNLLDQPWIVCVTSTGTEKLSIRQIFDGTTTPIQVLGDSPTQDYAVLRVLLAIFWRAHRGSPEDSPSWEKWFIAKRQELIEQNRDDRVLEYLDEYQHRFDLFDNAARSCRWRTSIQLKQRDSQSREFCRMLSMTISRCVRIRGVKASLLMKRRDGSFTPRRMTTRGLSPVLSATPVSKAEGAIPSAPAGQA